MSKRYSIAEARSHLPAIVDQAEAGLQIELTRRGKPVALVVSQREFERLRCGRPDFIEAYKRFVKKHALREVGLEKGFAGSVRQKEAGRPVSL